MLASRLGALIKERRMLRQLTQAELARLAGVSRAVIMRLERPGGRCVRIEVVEQVLRALGLRIRIADHAVAPMSERAATVVMLH
ncbi:MAG TPA: helix-turn-helix domain-containing protein [Casimicrobiaceae bacterium]|nr:helix-turn-helix domain-containing protein [Casimicrobiaceae bacterium]